MELPEAKVNFIVGLSNGESLMEGEGILAKIAGELSPWHKLENYLQEKDLSIKSLSLISKTEVGNRHYHLPNEKGKFGGEVPIGYRCFRRGAIDGLMSEQSYELYTCAEAIYQDYKVQLYVSEIDPDKCWVNIVTNTNGE